MNLHLNSRRADKAAVQAKVVAMLDSLPQPVLLAADLNKMASKHGTVANITEVLLRTDAWVQGIPERRTAVERDEPCLLALYCRKDYVAQAYHEGLAMASCYGVRPVGLVKWNVGDPHHPVHGEISLRRETRDEPEEQIETLRQRVTSRRVQGLIAHIRQNRVQQEGRGPRRREREGDRCG